ncbi:MAG TPA: PAS domain S-box protein [Thermodesulfovibrionales bacterium]|nr:PAS domain S-box protein [Thermodesulfovibrionales bacterium]
MTLRRKLSLLLSLFLVIIAILATGTVLISNALNEHLSSLATVSEETKMLNELDRSISEFVEAIREWGLTGDIKYKKLYGKRLADVYKSFGTLSMMSKHREDIQLLSRKFQTILETSRTVLSKPDEVGAPVMLERIKNIEAVALEIISRIDEVQEYTLVKVTEAARTAEKAKRRMVVYHASLVAFTSFISLFLFIRIRRAISDPFNELLKATGKISEGDLSYRIHMDRADEFGIVARRFDDMVAELESSSEKLRRKLNETQLLLDIARVAGTSLERKDSFGYIVQTIVDSMHYGSCAVYMLDADKDSFRLEFSNDPEDAEKRQNLSLSALSRTQVCQQPDLLMEMDFRDLMQGFGLTLEHEESGIVVPIIRDTACIGLLIVRNTAAYVFSDDERNILKIISHTIGSVIRNAELYLATRQHAEKMTVLFDLSRAVTSVLDLETLLRKIAEEIARLVSSRGCIIRLIEENTLKVKSSYGLDREIERSLHLAVGEGIAGWVAEHGEPMLVEDTGRIAMNMRIPDLDLKTVICVPLKIGDTVIGTVSLYDKHDERGALTPFSADDLGTLEGFASISSIAIEKARIYEEEVNRQRLAVEEKKRLNILFDSVQGGIITLDRNFVITSVNKYIEDWIGLSGSSLIGKDSQQIFHDKIGICPHCASKPTFDTGEINTITQSRGVNYAELTAYPIRNELGDVSECVVFIMDITERILYQEETLSLYREVIQTKEYLESIIDNSADAIVTSDLVGLVTSWNQGAEKIFGFTEEEVIGRFLPFVPDVILESENENMARLKQGEVLKDIETLRKKKDGSIIEVSLTLSPIKDAAGEVIGICGISRDISEKKRVEKELIRRSQEMSRLFFISSAMRSTLELNKLLRMVLTAVTMSDGMGFNRAILFLVNEERQTLKGVMGVGPATPEEAWKIWDELSLKRKSLDDIMQEIVSSAAREESFLERLAEGIEIPLADETVLTRTVRNKVPYNVHDVRREQLADAVLIQQLGTQAYAVVPLISRDKVIGLIWVDNYFNRKDITEEDMQFLASFSNQVASAIESARLFEQVAMAEQQLENIFESMSDMVYFNSSDYVIKRINKAVANKLRLPESEILGRKCYELFHGTKEPYVRCPHHKTVNTKLAYIEELDDPHLGGTFLTSSSPIFDSSGEFIGSVHVVRDITELKHLQKKLVLSEKMAALGEVAAKVAHEIRNPLVSVGGFAKRLEKKLDGNLQEYAGIIVKEVSRLEGILREILGFVKEVRLAKEPVNLNFLMDEIIRLMESDIEERGVVLTREYQDIPEIFIDPNRVKEAIVNIITNAVQALSGAGTVGIRTYMNENNVVLEIRDTGRGIPPEELPSIFNPFFTTKTSGTGLGLAITHRIIQEHNGRIEVESMLEKGTVFRIYLPIKEAAL